MTTPPIDARTPADPAEAVAQISAAEGLPAHRATATRRLARLGEPAADR